MTSRQIIGSILAGLGLLALTALASSLAGSLVPYTESLSIGKDLESFEELSDRFQNLAKEKGAPYAFDVLRRADLPPQTDLHLLAHAIGDVLYMQEGVMGMRYCTPEFRNACSHSVVIGALDEYGHSSTTMQLIDEACRKAPGGSGAYTMCYHGLGHGIFAYFDYSLPETVDLCRTTGTPEYGYRQYVECVGGAIMELMGGGGHDPASWTRARATYLADDPLSPCLNDLIPEEAKQVCLSYLTPRLWELAGISLGLPEPDLFARAFSFCESIPGTKGELRDSCFGGFGKEFVVLVGARDVRKIDSYSDEMLLVAIRWCDLAGVDDGVRSCVRSELDSIFWGGENNPDAAFRFCSLVPNAGTRDSCYDRLAQDLGMFLPDQNEREPLCSRLPESARARCEQPEFTYPSL